MAVGIIIHVSVGSEKRTELFSEENIRFGSDETCDLQIHTKKISAFDVWFELSYDVGVYRLININKNLDLTLNGAPLRGFAAVRDGDTIEVLHTDISFSFFTLQSDSSLITTNREQPHVAQFIEEAALEASVSPQRDDAKTFLREFVLELSREVSWVTKSIFLVLALGFISGIFYIGFAINDEIQKNRLQVQQQNQIISQIQDKLAETNDQIGDIDKSNKDIIKTISLGQNLRVEYGNGICLIVGVYDLVDRRTGRTLRYPDPQTIQENPYPPNETGELMIQPQMQLGLTTEGNGTPVEYDFIGTGFHVGGGYIVTNRHVVQPWKEDDYVQQLIRDSRGRARIKRLVIYFPNFAKPFPLQIRKVAQREDLAVGTIDPETVTAEIPVLPLDVNSDAVAVGKTVVSMGYPNGPDRLLAMVEDEEAKSINARFGGSRQALINFLAQSQKIVPLTTQGAITDLDARRIVHDAKTAEGGSGAPLFGQNGKVIGVNFGVFTQSTAANMAIPISFAFDLLTEAGWISPDEKQDANIQNQNTETKK